ncbi:MAG: hypothetical protein ACR2OA_08000 [Rubripirellula sp.]
MQLERLVCNACGAPLEVPASAKFVTCGHCSGQLQIRRTESAVYTEILADLAEKTEELSERIDDLAANSELTAIDSNWQIERESLMVRDKHGNRHVPTKGSSIGTGVAATLFGCFWTVMAIRVTSTAPAVGLFSVTKIVFPAFGIIVIALGIYNSMSNFKKAEKYKRAERRYRQERSETDRS